MTLKFFSPDRIAGAIAIMIGSFSIIESIKLYPYGTGILTGDHAFPGIIGALLVIAGILLLIEQRNDRSYLPKGRKALTLFSSIGILFVYCFLISLIGYFFSTFLTFACLLKILGNYRWIHSTLLAGILTTVLYFLFIVLLKTPFPSIYFPF
jgi:putative tricarboxylic transport membrane protein